MQKHFLVTGGAGFIGRYVVNRLLRSQHRVTVLDDLSSGKLTALPHGEAGFRFVHGSICDAVAVRQAADGATAVFHLAGVVGMRVAVAQRERAFEVAFEGTRVVLESTGQLPILLASSSAVYGVTPQNPVAESMVEGEDHILTYDGGEPGYALGKFRAEQLAQTEADRGRSVCIVRPFNVVGLGQTGEYGMVLPSLYQRALSGLPLVIHDDGRQTRSFSEVRCFVDCVDRLFSDSANCRYPGNVFNVGNPSESSVLELAYLILEKTRSSSTIQFVPYNEIYPGRKDVRRRIPSVQRLESAIGPVRWPSLQDIVGSVAENVRYTAV